MSVVASVGERAWCVEVPHHVRGASLARRQLAADLTDAAVDPDTAGDVVTIVSELVGNAARHARPLPGGVIRVSWSIAGDMVEVQVSDGGAVAAPTLRTVDPEAVDGRGLAIVAALARRWGVAADGAGRCVWAEVPCA